MRKVPFLMIILFISFGGAVYWCTRLYYVSSYIPKGSVTIIPSEYWHEDPATFTNNKPTVVLNDPTLESKFVGSPTSNNRLAGRDLEIKGHEDEKSNVHRDTNFETVPVESKSIQDSWVKAGTPYVVPQMSKEERSIKIKRLLPPESGAGHGTK
ncbi:plasmid transfer protein HtdO [Enterobacter hormaechei]